jgi:FKBP-type peptidyl-prolyl cis-trans isomerase 2
MATAKEGDVVKVEYTGKFDDGSVFDSSEGREPLQFKLGANDVIPGFEQAVTGMNIGDSKTVKIPAEDAYGPHQDDLAMVVDRSEFPDDLQPEIGDRLQLTDDDGRVLVVTVTEASPKTLTLDANHPLAGKDLTFDIKLVEVKG